MIHMFSVRGKEFLYLKHFERDQRNMPVLYKILVTLNHDIIASYLASEWELPSNCH
jgi:hypothetical protein